MEFMGFRGFQEDRTDHTVLLANFQPVFGGTWGQKVHLATCDGKLTFQSTRNGPQNISFCPGSLQDAFIIYSSISHQHIYRKYVATNNISIIKNLKI